jgi:diguanylate cyclase (GGDEF)-like protein
MNAVAHGRRATVRLFAVYAIVSLIPIAILGFILAADFRSEAQSRGIDQARSEAHLIAQTAVEPLLNNASLSDGIPVAVRTRLRRLVRQTVNRTGQGTLRLRLRDQTGRVVFSDDGTGFDDQIDDEAVDATHGETIAILTHLNTDETPTHPGPRAVEIYLPLRAGSPMRTVGVLELYLSYAPINREVAGLLSTMYRNLIIGLGALYLALFAISASVTRRLRRQSQVNARLAQYDTLTGLPNRSLFEQRATAALELARRNGAAIAIAVLDLDRFKEINDTLGHRNGDEVLTELARRLAAAAGPDMTVARLSGDEFGLVLPCKVNPEADLAEIRRVLEGDLMVGGLTLSVQASVGYALAPADADDIGTLMRRADVAMYLAKAEHAGIARYDVRRDQYDAATLGLVAELRHAIDSEQLVLHYQPQRDLATGRTTAIEALVRWQHPTRGLLYPDTFLPLAEQTDLIDQLTRWVLRRALTDLQHLGEPAAELSVAVNVSARGIGRGELANDVIEILRDVAADPRRLVIEVTETTILADPARAATELRRLTTAGVKISLDDFGQGQTSLGHLSALPLAELKIDRGFVGDMLEHPAHAAIVHSVIDLGHNLGLRVVAEGVETGEVFTHLSHRGCDLVQGYLLSRPVPLNRVADWLAAERIARGAPAPAFAASTAPAAELDARTRTRVPVRA